MTHHDESIPPYCEIRDVAIDNPFYTYCATHPHRRPNRDRIPIGPIMRHGGFIDGLNENPREVWIPSPDSDEIRLHLLALLGNFFEHVFKGRYPIGQSLSRVIIWQLGQFREHRAAKHIEWISKNVPDDHADAARKALAQIRDEG